MTSGLQKIIHLCLLTAHPAQRFINKNPGCFAENFKTTKMKKITLSLSLFSLFASCSVKDKELPVPAVRVSKSVTFSIAPVFNYNEPYYNGATAELKLAIYKQYSEPYSISVLWDTILPRQELKNYMQMPIPNIISKTFSDLDETQYKIGVSYSIGYITAPPLSANQWSAMGEVLPNGNVFSHLVNVPL
jgi:hypothetical protein